MQYFDVCISSGRRRPCSSVLNRFSELLSIWAFSSFSRTSASSPPPPLLDSRHTYISPRSRADANASSHLNRYRYRYSSMKHKLQYETQQCWQELLCCPRLFVIASTLLCVGSYPVTTTTAVLLYAEVLHQVYLFEHF